MIQISLKEKYSHQAYFLVILPLTVTPPTNKKIAIRITQFGMDVLCENKI